MPDLPTSGPTRPVGFLVVDDHQMLDLAGPADVFRTAELLHGPARYPIRIATPDGGPVRATNGITVAADGDLASLADGTLDTLVVVGGLGVRAAGRDPELLGALRRAAAAARRVTSVCSGALLLATAGLLDGRRATTHWASCDELAAHPGVGVVGDRIFVRDGDVWTSAGVTAGIDLALALVDDDHGPELAHQVAAWLVVFTRRPGGQAQFSTQLRARPPRRHELAELLRWIPDHLCEDLRVPALAARCGMSERTFVRAWREETGTTPAAYVEAARLEAARRLLESTDMSVAAVAAATGFVRAERLHRAARRRLGTTPATYRDHFAHTAGDDGTTDGRHP